MTNIVKIKEPNTSVFQVLTTIKELILEEPRRIDMGTGLQRRKGLVVDPLSEHLSRTTPLRGELGWPDCGTIGCIGGLGWLLVGHSERLSPNFDMLGMQWGLTPKQSTELFWPDTLSSNGLLHWSSDYGVGTPEYAQIVAQHISNFQRKYEDQLRNTIATIFA